MSGRIRRRATTSRSGHGHVRCPSAVQTANVSRRRLLSFAVLAIVAAATVSGRLRPHDPGSDGPPAAHVSAIEYLEPKVSITLRGVPAHRIPQLRWRVGEVGVGR